MEDIGVILSSNKKGERGKNGREVKENMEEMKRRKNMSWERHGARRERSEKHIMREMVYLLPEVALLTNFYNHPSSIYTCGFNLSLGNYFHEYIFVCDCVNFSVISLSVDLGWV